VESKTVSGHLTISSYMGMSHIPQSKYSLCHLTRPAIHGGIRSQDVNQFVIANNTTIGGNNAGIWVEGEAPNQTITITSGYVVNNLIYDAGRGQSADSNDGFWARGAAMA